MDLLCITGGHSSVTVPFLLLIHQGYKAVKTPVLISCFWFWQFHRLDSKATVKQAFAALLSMSPVAVWLKRDQGGLYWFKPGSNEVDTWSAQMIASSPHFLACSCSSQGQSSLLFPYWDTEDKGAGDAGGVRRQETWSWLAGRHLTASAPLPLCITPGKSFVLFEADRLFSTLMVTKSVLHFHSQSRVWGSVYTVCVQAVCIPFETGSLVHFVYTIRNVSFRV